MEPVTAIAVASMGPRVFRALRRAGHGGGYVVVLEDGTRLRLSRDYRDELAAVLGAKL